MMFYVPNKHVEFDEPSSEWTILNEQLEVLSFFLIELSLVEYEMLKFPPSLLAAAAIFTAQCTLYGFKQWTKTCEWHSNYTEDQLL